MTDNNKSIQESEQLDAKHIGVHLSGSNSNKTSLVLLEGDIRLEPLRLVRVYEKIGSYGSSLSDDRLLNLFSLLGARLEVFVDCPLTLPPCVSCTRESCPGITGCDDISVAYMASVNAKLKSLNLTRRRRPLNPQSQRLWDLFHSLNATDSESCEPSFSSNLVPLVIRARSLQRRLRGEQSDIQLLETSVPLFLQTIEEILGLGGTASSKFYRHWEKGRQARRAVIEAMIDQGWLAEVEFGQVESFNMVESSIENFNAFVCAWAKALSYANLTIRRPQEYLSHEGWVHLPSERCADLF